MAGPRRRKGDKQDDGTADGAGDQGNSTAHSHSGSEPVRSGNSTPTDTEDGLPPRQITLKRAKRPSLAGKGRLSYTLQAPGTPWHELDLSEVDFLRHDVNEEPKTWVRYRRLFFVVGVALGAVLVLLFGTNAELDRHYRGLRLLLDEQIGNLDLSLDFKLPGEFAELAETLFSQPREWLATKDFRVGRRLLAQGYRAHHPVVLVPGIVSTGLESWSTSEDASGYFRKRLWGTTTMMRTIVFEKEMWVKHLSLDPVTGLDPPGIKVRAAEGLDAASYFITGYWIWSKIIENLAVLGYDTNMLSLASYDWRLSYSNLEVRDDFFSRLKLKIERNTAVHGKKTVLVAHSMGSSVVLYFLKWVEAEGPGFGNGGPSWVEEHIEAFTSIAGTWLGVPKAMSALLSGEMRDTVELNPAGVYLLEKFFSRKERAKLFRTWAGSASMLVKGGEAVWGNSTWAPDDEPNAEDTHGHVFSFKQPGVSQDDLNAQTVQSNLTASEAQTWLMQHSPSTFQRMLESNYSNGIERSEEQLKLNNQDPTKWANPLEVTLPYAPSMKIYCLYGHGKPTERSYWYAQGEYERDEHVSEGEAAQCADCDNVTVAAPLGLPLGRTTWIDTSIQKEDATPKVRAGCKMGEGDGTVSLLSLGAMCAEGWKKKRYNPAGSTIVTHEVRHEPDGLDLRGGQTTGDHVDILGAWRVNDYIGRIAAGRGSEVQDHYVSRIQEYAKAIKWDEE